MHPTLHLPLRRSTGRHTAGARAAALEAELAEMRARSARDLTRVFLALVAALQDAARARAARDAANERANRLAEAATENGRLRTELTAAQAALANAKAIRPTVPLHDSPQARTGPAT